MSPWRREPVPNQKTTVGSLRDSETLFRRPARAVRMCVSTVSRPDAARTGHACCRAPPRVHRARWIHLRASKPGDSGRHRSVAVWRRSQQARSFEGSGHLGPHDRAHARLSSARLGTPVTRRASEFNRLTAPKTPPYPGAFSTRQGFCRRGGSPHRLPAGSEEPEGGSCGTPPL